MSSARYPARLTIDYPEKLDRTSTALRLFAILPILVILSFLTDGCGPVDAPRVLAGERVLRELRAHGIEIPADVAADVRREARDDNGGGGSSSAVTGGLFAATALMLTFRRRYPKWWFEFIRELTRFSLRVFAYGALLTDKYPSTEDEQDVHVEIDAPDAQQLSRWQPLLKWLFVLPHFLLLALLSVAAGISVVVAWFAILLTGAYPRALFDFVVGVMRWGLRVDAYAFLLVTDEYPPFSLD